MSDQERPFDLEERTFRFALAVRHMVGGHKWKREQWTDIDQVLRSSGSVAANHTEANNPVSSADFAHRLKDSRKEASESRLWPRLLGATSPTDSRDELRTLYREADDLTRILSSSIKKL